jgi:hypothetical protein
MSDFKKLSVLKREEKESGWHPTPAFDITKIKEIKIFDSRSDKSLNAIPSPLARLHLFDAAFSLVHEDESQKTNYSGYAYKKLVSDCFDVFELIYNWNYHKQEGKPLTILSWSKEEEIANLKSEFELELKKIEERPKNNDESETQINLQEIEGFKTYLVGKTLSLFLNQSDFAQFKEFHIIKYNKTVIAGTSPFTGFFTTPNDLSSLDLINPFTRKKYFDSNPRTFESRDEKIKKYIDDFFQSKTKTGSRVFSNQLAVIDYLKHNKPHINSNLILNLEPITPLVNIFSDSITIETSKDRNDYLENYLVKINYRINDNCFYTASNLNPKRSYDYLLPLSPAFFSDFASSENGFDARKISSLVTITEKGESIVEVSIKAKNGKPISKTYQVNKSHPLDGEIVNLSDGFGLNLSLSLFPNVIVENRPEMNNYFKVMLGLKSKDKKFANKDIQLSFFANNKKIEEDGPNIKCTPVTRTELSDNFFGSSYFELNGKFDFIQIAINSDYYGGIPIHCSVVPKWNNSSKLGDKKFKCAIDFGTTTTFVGLRDKGNNEAPVALSIEEQSELLVAHFHNPKEIVTTNIKQSPFDYEAFESFNEFAALEIKEFLPVIIGSAVTSKFKFPLRTAICELNSASPSLSALSNANIAFGYEKITLADKHQSIKTNLKWSVEGKTEDRIKIFLEELSKIIKYKIIRNGGNPYFTDIIWFYPLSFADWNKRIFAKIWKEIFEKEFKDNSRKNQNLGSTSTENIALKNEEGRLIELTESEAPIHFHKVNANLKELTKVLSIDIGGGSTDIVYYHSGNLKIGSSFNFATNLLWSDGNIRVSNRRENGIFNEFASKITSYLNDKSSTEIDKRSQAEYFRTKLINTEYLDNLSYGSDDIINFWLSNNTQTNLTSFLSRSQYRLNFLFFFSAIVYHTAQLLKSKGDDKRPACICLSGNGSKVIDLITDDENVLSKICKYLINSAFEITDNNYSPQVILPNSLERKEATCFGGLYEDEVSGKPIKSTHLGNLNSDQETFKNVEHYKEITSSLENSIHANVEKFISVFKKMNSHINFKNDLGLDVPLDALGNFMSQSFTKNYQYEKDRKASETKPDETINDSPFFWALKGLLFDLSILDASKLEVYRNRIDLFFERPTIDGEFPLDKISKIQLDSSLYKVEIEEESSNNGRLYLLTESEYTLKTALSNTEANLLPVCNYSKSPNASTSSIRVINYGEVENINGAWVIRKKIEIEFI